MTFAFFFPCTHNVLSLLNLFGESKQATMATVRIAVFLTTFNIALGILNPCEYYYLPYIRSRIELNQFVESWWVFFLIHTLFFNRAPPLTILLFANAFLKCIHCGIL